MLLKDTGENSLIMSNTTQLPYLLRCSINIAYLQENQHTGGPIQILGRVGSECMLEE